MDHRDDDMKEAVVTATPAADGSSSGANDDVEYLLKLAGQLGDQGKIAAALGVLAAYLEIRGKNNLASMALYYAKELRKGEVQARAVDELATLLAECAVTPSQEMMDDLPRIPDIKES